MTIRLFVIVLFYAVSFVHSEISDTAVLDACMSDKNCWFDRIFDRKNLKDSISRAFCPYLDASDFLNSFSLRQEHVELNDLTPKSQRYKYIVKALRLNTISLGCPSSFAERFLDDVASNKSIPITSHIDKETESATSRKIMNVTETKISLHHIYIYINKYIYELMNHHRDIGRLLVGWIHACKGVDMVKIIMLFKNETFLKEVISWLSLISSSVFIMAIVIMFIAVSNSKVVATGFLDEISPGDVRRDYSCQVDEDNIRKASNERGVNEFAATKMLERQRDNLDSTSINSWSNGKNVSSIIQTPEPNSPSKQSLVSSASHDGSTIRSDSVYSTIRPDLDLLSKEAVLAESIRNPRVLVGWQITVSGLGLGTILATEKTAMRSTVYKVELLRKEVKLIPLKRSPKKGSVPFELIRKIN